LRWQVPRAHWRHRIGAVADRGLTRPATGIAMVAALLVVCAGCLWFHFHSMIGSCWRSSAARWRRGNLQVLSSAALCAGAELRGDSRAVHDFIFMCAAVASALAAAVMLPTAGRA